jgi:hypothetical protein
MLGDGNSIHPGNGLNVLSVARSSTKSFAPTPTSS